MMDLQFEEDGHSYTLNGRRVPSVTDVLEPLQLFDGIPPDVLEAARVFGGHVAMACDMHNKGTLDWDSMDSLLASYIRGYLKFLAETSFVILASEERVASVKCGYAGTLDLRGIMNRKSWIVDSKSTHVLPRTVGPQTSAYLAAFNEMTGEAYKHRACLHLKPDGYTFVPLEDKGKRIADYTLFVSQLNVYRWFKDI
jgi:hypothetical protein